MAQFVGGHQSVRTIRLPGGARVVLQAWAAVEDDRFHNVVRIEANGTISWRATLPGDVPRDCFVRMSQCDGAVVAETFSGLSVNLDPTTGQSLGAIAA